MLKNRDVFLRDPTTFTIPNDGVAEVLTPRTPEEWEVLHYELSSFVCEGEYRRGLERILSTYLANLGRPKQPAVWVSGFYGSGKSHLVRVLEYLWRDVEFPDGARARGLSKLPTEIEDALVELTTAGRRAGGLWSAAGKLSAGAGSVRLALLSMLFRSADLPSQYETARFVIWLKQKGFFEKVMANVAQQGERFAAELNNMYVSPVLAQSLLTAWPEVADTPREVRDLLKTQFPKQDEIDDDTMLQTVEDVLRLQATTSDKLPCTLFVFDELQQFIGDDSDRTLQVQDIVEACTSRFGSTVLFVGTGQAALEATPQLSKLQDRFTVRVSLEDKDVERVVREVVLRKAPDKMTDLHNVLDGASGEIDRHLAGTKIAPSQADRQSLAPDYPLLPTRRRFWERVLRAIDVAGTAGQLRTQLRVVHEATKTIADRPLGTVVPGDMIYDQQKAAMLQSSVLLREVATIIDELKAGTPGGELQARLCATIFLIGKLPTDGVLATGLRATADTLADLLVEDLPTGSAELRQKIPPILQGLVDQGTLMLVDNEYRLQTRESAEWEGDYRKRYARIAADDSRLASDRTTAFRTAITTALKGVKLTQGANKTPRKFELYFGANMPQAETETVPVWVRDEWSVSEKTVREEAQAANDDSPIIFVLLPRQEPEALKTALAGYAAATETLEARPARQTTPEGMEARQAMQTRQQVEKEKVDTLVAGILHNARVFQGGGNEVVEQTLPDTIRQAVDAALIRLFPNFSVTDVPGWGNVVKRASQGAGDALAAVGYMGDVEQHPACRDIRSYIGAGKKGSDIRKHFRGVGYGWPQDAVDGALLALMAAGFVRAEKNKQAQTVKQINQSQIGVLDFFNEGVTVTAIQRIGVRKLISDIGLPLKQGEEAEAIPLVLQQLITLAGEAGGEPPLPVRPDPTFIQDLQALSGNEQFVAVYDQRQKLLDSHREWTQCKVQRAQRWPRWELLQQLLRQAADLQVTDKVKPQVKAILQARTLLTDPDPVSPLIDQVATALRTALQAVRQRHIEAYQHEVGQLEASTEWQQLEADVQQEILTANALTPVADLRIGTDTDLLRALEVTPLTTWNNLTAALPSRVARARLEAARRLEPEAVKVWPEAATLRTENEVEDYLAKLRTEIMGHIEAGYPVVL
jgi:hypothetical protein